MNKLKRNKKTANKVLSIFLVFALVMTFFSLPQTVEKVYAQEEQTEEEYLYIPLYSRPGQVEKVKISDGTSEVIQVGNNPVSATMDANGLLYVSNRGSKTISVIDMDKFEIVDTINIGKQVNGVTLDPAFENLYIGTDDGIDVYNIENKTKETILSGSKFMLCSVTEDKVYAVEYIRSVSEGNSNFYIYDIGTESITTKLDVGAAQYLGNIVAPLSA